MMKKRYIFSILVALLSCQVYAQVKQELPDLEKLELAVAPINRSDMDSVKRGAKFFATNCNSCHALNYLRYDPIVKDAGIVFNRVPPPLPVPPPDLSLEADVRGVNWIYTYLHSFYKDPKSATGSNNLLFPNTSMPDIVGPYQGEQMLVDSAIPDLYGDYEWYDWVKLTREGSMTPEQFDTATGDLVNFLAYASAPYHEDQERLGYWVLGFLAIMFVLMFALKKEYWKDVYRKKD